MNEFAREFLEGESFRLVGANRQWGILDDGIRYPLMFDGKEVGELFVDENVNKAAAEKFAHHAAALVHAGDEKVEEMLKVLAWLRTVKAIDPKRFTWIGIYYRASYLLGEDGTDLVLGPFIGAPTDHVRIPLERGLCGLALREERVVNQADVHADPRHIACSITTKSELIVPLPVGQKGNYIAELDIDSDTAAAFSPEIEAKVQALCKDFPL